MNREAFYQELGRIDDDLIQAANESPVKAHKRPLHYRMIGIAACLCLLCGGIFFGLHRDTIYFNDLPTPAATKVTVPADENTMVMSMTYQELLAYYGIEQLPILSEEEWTRTEDAYFVLCQTQTGSILYDTNTLYYSSTDNSKTLSVTLAKTGSILTASSENTKTSRIGGVSLLLAASQNGTDATTYWADCKVNGVSVRMVADGLDKDAFIHIIKELIHCLK